jgi:thymidylate synthase (FAD)
MKRKKLKRKLMKIAKQEVTLLDHMGTDLTVVNSARVSFHKESEWEEYGMFDAMPTDNRPTHYDPDFRVHKILSEKDVKLINYLAKHNHWTPFAHCFASFHVKVPMFVAMQLDKHTVGLVTNSVSRRYVDDEPEFFFPEEWRGKPINAKQGSSGVLADMQPELVISATAQYATQMALNTYQDLLAVGVAPEQARMVLPMNTMTERIWSGSLAAFARVCKLRLDPHAQQEIQEVAQRVDAALQPLFPVSWEALKGN